ncbi:unnamed protein product [Soboliphyme baturini]|uniref:Uncharacterized protein n=1 Tax=Soboliphyme baturini TaxID=241478 RepID=A0A183J0Y8_9BILA|nr:unnamed protein product [Soboliphyme baturini]
MKSRRRAFAIDAYKRGDCRRMTVCEWTFDPQTDLDTKLWFAVPCRQHGQQRNPSEQERNKSDVHTLETGTHEGDEQPECRGLCRIADTFLDSYRFRVTHPRLSIYHAHLRPSLPVMRCSGADRGITPVMGVSRLM